ncbi:nuclease [Stutzerimonas urumqiensis]|uniref:thermonuclease family protein n=1 Tax=Stutzerimonas urumqiensis TaxID=638269 RepID=UPI003BA8C6E3
MRKGIALVVLCLLGGAVQAGSIDCRVVGVSDGDTFTCLNAGKRQIKVRMAEIDTPESKQPFGTRSKQALSALVFGKAVRLDVQDTDRYGRSVARAFVGTTDVNRELVRQGAAWVYRDYLRDRTLLSIEDEARKAGRGLWALPETERMPPWEWRRAAREQRQQAITTKPAQPIIRTAMSSSAAAAYSCSPRKTCGQMANCAEAQFHLNECGNSRLDRDNDSIPCESLCN